jgi:hypothetical protein
MYWSRADTCPERPGLGIRFLLTQISSLPCQTSSHMTAAERWSRAQTRCDERPLGSGKVDEWPRSVWVTAEV